LKLRDDKLAFLLIIGGDEELEWLPVEEGYMIPS